MASPRLVLASALLIATAAGAAFAQEADQDAPVATSTGGWAGEASQTQAPAPAVVQATPPAPAGNPLASLNDVPRDRGILTGVHGSAGIVIGSHDTRGAYATVHGPLGDNARFSLGFSTLSTDADPYGSYYPYGYGAGTRSSVGAAFEWRPGNDRPPFAYDPYQADWPGYPGMSGEYSTDVTDAPGR